MSNLTGEKITIQDDKLNVPNFPIIPFIEGDGIGPDIWKSAVNVLDSAVESAYQGSKKIIWKEVYAGEKANAVFQKDIWLPEETIDIIGEYKVAIKGPLTTPVGGGIRSINVALRQKLDLYVCLRPVRYFQGVPSPIKNPENTDMVIFRENTEDIYAGIEFANDTQDANLIKDTLQKLNIFKKVRFPDTASFGIKPISAEGTKRLVNAAIQYAIDNDRKSITLVHKGNIMKYTEGYFRKWGYELAKEQFNATELDGGPWLQFTNPKTDRQIIVKDVIADAFLQQILTRPKEYDVVATMNLNGDYISDALAAQVGGIGIAPGANINYQTGIAIFEATHGTAPKYAGLDKVNPSSVILSGEMMLRYMGWKEAADKIISAMEKVLQGKQLTYDFARLIPDAQEISCSAFGEELTKNY